MTTHRHSVVLIFKHSEEGWSLLAGSCDLKQMTTSWTHALKKIQKEFVTIDCAAMLNKSL
jgi:hypothetical protein